MDDTQIKKQQIDDEALRVIEKAERDAIQARQLLADQEAERVRWEAEEKAKQIQNDAQK